MPSFTTVFGNQDNAPLDVSLLKALFSGHELGQGSKHASSGKKRDGICVLDFRRAMGMEIALSRISVSTLELSSCLSALDFAYEGVGVEDIERLLGKMPTPEEAQMLLKHAGAPEALRDLERQLLPLCTVPDAERRLRLFHVAKSHAALHARLLDRFEHTQQAALEVLASSRLHHVLRYSLQIANYINHGSLEGAKTYSVASFSAFASFKLGTSSALHYLCLTLCNAEFVRGLKADLSQVFDAARESSEVQQEELRTFATFVQDAQEQLQSEVDEAAHSRTAELLRVLRLEQTQLQQAEKRARSRVEEAQRFLGERSTVLAKSETFFTHIVGLVRHLEDTLRDLAQNPQRWQDLPAAVTPAPGDSEGLECRSPPSRTKRVSLLADGLSVQRVTGAVNSGAFFPGDSP